MSEKGAYASVVVGGLFGYANRRFAGMLAVIEDRNRLGGPSEA